MPYYKVYDPPLALRGIIREIQIYHAKWEAENDLPEPFITCLANNEQNLYFFVNEPMKVVPAARVEVLAPAVVVTGPKYKPVGLLFGKDHLMIKIAFHPTGTYRLLGIDMRTTVNNGLDATEFWGNEINDTLHRLRQVTSPDIMFDIVCSFIGGKFNEHIRPEEPIDKIAIRMLDPSHNHSLKEWASKACLSLRQFERNFMARVGISPKLFLRIARFEYSMRIKNKCPQKNWSEIALECGYNDSSHLLREYKEFADFPPSQFYYHATSGYSGFPTG